MLVSLHDFRGKWVVLYFYPKDFTSGCAIEAHNFRDLSQYELKNAVVLGVSVQSSNLAACRGALNGLMAEVWKGMSDFTSYPLTVARTLPKHRPPKN
jgi:peroxiredoxin